MSVSLRGTVTDRLLEAVAYMHKQRRRVVAVRGRVARREEPQVRLRYRNAEMREPTDAELEVLLDRIVAANPDFQTAVGNEQWGYRLTSVYALLRLAEQGDEVVSLLREVLGELRRLGLEDRAPDG